MEALAGCRTLQEVIDLLATHNGDSRKLEPAPSTGTAEETLAAASQAVPPMPFIGPIVSLTPGEELVARCEINLVEGLFLRDHTLGRQVSVTDPKLRGLPIMPLTMSMEILAEGAAVLIPGQRLVEMRNVRAYRWLAFEGDRVELVLRARRHPSVSGHKVHVQMHGADDADGSQHPAATPIVEGTMIFGEMYPEPPAAGEVALRKERPSRWAPESLYTEGMFHGPAFRGVVSMDRWGEDGAEATLEVLPLKGLLAADRDRTFLIDPVLLDQPGQVVAFWMAEHVERGYVIFPFHLEALHLFGPPLPPRERVKCQARTTLVGDWQVRSDLDIVRADGKVWARFLGWEDRRFDLPRSFFRFQLSPRDVILSEPWSIPVASLPEPEEFQACRLNLDTFPEDLFTAHGRIWQRVLAHLVLSRRERELWSSLMTPEPRRIEWLLGRVAAKDAVRQYLRQRYDVVLCPADVEILPDSNGRPVVQGAWSNEVPCVPILSLSHSGGVAVAVVGNSDAATGVGVDIEHVGRMREGTEKLAFTSEERALLSAVPDAARDSWPLQLWCAKEAVAKALGQGLVGGPQALVIEELDSDTRTVHVGLAGEMAHRFPAISEGPIVAYTAREHDLIVATALYAHGPGKGNPT
jgi:phosphopantetheinyl transferase